MPQRSVSVVTVHTMCDQQLSVFWLKSDDSYIQCSMKSAWKQSGMAALQQAVAYAASLAQGNGEVLYKVNFDAALEEGLDMLGVPPNLLRSDEEAQQIRTRRAQQAVQLAAQQNTH